VLGKTGRGIAEHCDVPASRIDIWMGTLSKTLASVGGFIAGSRELIEILKHTAPGFVYSVGLPAAMTAAALASLETIQAEPERIEQLRRNGQLFLQIAKEEGLDTRNSVGRGMVPVIAGDVIKPIKLWHAVFARGVNPSLIVYPGVPMKAGRLRFFLNSEHKPDQIREALRVTREELARL
jgi:8-amino-7-oxononanoate synthase